MPPHIWFLATYYRDDYLRANVPMLPVVTDTSGTAVGIGLGALTMGYSVAGLYAANAIGPAALLYGLLAAAHIFALAVKLSTMSAEEAREFSHRAFRIVNMHLGLFYVVMVVEKALTG